jgi:hypothetical protein
MEEKTGGGRIGEMKEQGSADEEATGGTKGKMYNLGVEEGKKEGNTYLLYLWYFKGPTLLKDC